MKRPVEPPVELAFYKAPGRIEDRIIRWATGSPYSHVELVTTGARGANGPIVARSISSSPRDGGVREKRIAFKPGHWDFVGVGRWVPQDAIDRARAELGRGYDWPGIVGTFVLGTDWHSRRLWFCSELIGMALRLDTPHRLSPGDLHRIATRRAAVAP